MTTRRLWLQPLAVIVLGMWRLAIPAQAVSAPTTACGQAICVLGGSCESGESECGECPSYVCLGTGHFPCPGSYMIYCNEIQ